MNLGMTMPKKGQPFLGIVKKSFIIDVHFWDGYATIFPLVV